MENISCERNDRLLFSGLSFHLVPGQLIQVDGPNGSGKTTLLRTVCGLLPLDQGAIYWCGEPIRKNRSDYLAELVFVGHKNGIKDDLTAEENLRIDQMLCARQSTVSIREALQLLRIGECRERLCREMSAGQRQRVALARLLVSAARLWVLDEPLTALDHSAQHVVRDMLADHVDRGGMALITSHQRLDWKGRIHQTVRIGDAQ